MYIHVHVICLFIQLPCIITCSLSMRVIHGPVPQPAPNLLSLLLIFPLYLLCLFIFPIFFLISSTSRCDNPIILFMKLKCCDMISSLPCCMYTFQCMRSIDCRRGAHRFSPLVCVCEITGVDTATGLPNGNRLTGRFQETLDTHMPYSYCDASFVTSTQLDRPTLFKSEVRPHP